MKSRLAIVFVVLFYHVNLECIPQHWLEDFRFRDETVWKQM